MKIPIAMLLAASFTFAAQETLIGGDGSISHGGFGAPIVKVTRIDGHSRVMAGAEGAWIINHSIYLGLSGAGSMRGIETDVYDTTGQRQYLHVGYGGLLLGMTFNSDKLVHFGFQNVIGGGNAMLSPDRWDDGESDHHDECEWDNGDHCSWNDMPFFVWEPQLQAEVNITRWMRIAAGAGYRFTWMIDEKNGYEKNDLGGLSAGVSLKFGKF